MPLNVTWLALPLPQTISVVGPPPMKFGQATKLQTAVEELSKEPNIPRVKPSMIAPDNTGLLQLPDTVPIYSGLDPATGAPPIPTAPTIATVRVRKGEIFI